MLAVDGESRCQMHARSRFVKFLAPLSDVKLVKGAIRASCASRSRSREHRSSLGARLI